MSILRGTAGAATVEISAVALREEDESVSGAILQLTDITIQRRLEAQLAQSQKLQAVGQLAGGIAHDFNNLLTAMTGAADDALARGLPDAETVEDLEQIRSSADRGAALVRQLLAFGRQQTLQPRPVSINAAVESVSGLLRRLLGSTIKLDLQLEDPGRTVRVDPTQLDQVLVNLAVNARDAMADGGQLTLRTGHIALYRALVRGEETIPPGRYVMIEVQDTGVGIPPDVLPRIFDPFFTTRRERGGSGLGLSTVHGIIRQSDGFLAVDSLVGKGTRIRIYLPRYDGDEVGIPTAPAPSLERTAPAERVNGRATARTVLLVDDEDGVRRLAVRALTKAGWAVLSAESGEAALALLATLGRRLCDPCRRFGRRDARHGRSHLGESGSSPSSWRACDLGVGLCRGGRARKPCSRGHHVHAQALSAEDVGCGPSSMSGVDPRRYPTRKAPLTPLQC